VATADPRDGLSPAKRRLLANWLRSGPPRGAGATQIPRRATAGPAPLATYQLPLWAHHRLNPNAPTYNVFRAYAIRGPLDHRALARALAELLLRHEVLRSTFPAGGPPMQAVSASAAAALPGVSLAGLPAHRRVHAAREVCEEEAHRPFDLARSPLLRALWLRLGEGEHLLLLNLHHIACDEWSLPIVLRDLAALYDAGRAGRPSPLPALPVQYADFAAWQESTEQADDLAEHLAFWREQLAGATLDLALPFDRPRSRALTNRGRREELPPDPELRTALSRLAVRLGSTLFVLLLAAWKALLFRSTGQPDLVVGTAVVHRDRPELAGLVGCFVDLVAVRCRPAASLPFATLAAGVRSAMLDGLAHSRVPLERLVRELGLARGAGAGPPLGCLFAWHAGAEPAIELTGCQAAAWPLRPRTVKNDLALALHGDDLAGAIEYRTELFDAATARRMAGQLARLLAGIAAHPEAHLADLPLLSAAERAQLLREWADCRAERPQGRTPVHELVALQAASRPRAAAVEQGGTRLTYADLDRRASALAQRLAALGLGPESVAGVLASPSAEMVVAQLAILKCGAAYLPLDPAYPAERLRMVLAEARVRLLLAAEARVSIASGLLGGGGRVLAVPPLATAEPAAPAARAALPASCPESAAYVIYTSGSTGRPKGVVLTHAGLANLVAWHRAAYRVGPGDRASLLASPGFDAAVWEVWPHLAAGATLVVADEDTRGDPARIVSWLAEKAITLSFLPTPLAEAALGASWPAASRLRALLTGGDRLGRRPPPGLPFRLVNHYGPTEATVVATAAAVAAGGGGPPAIGRPIDNVEVRVLDAAARPVPIGVRGELWIGGAGLARGYLDRPDLTAERFVPDPLGGPGARLYRSGDLGRLLPHGEIEFLGRRDRQVKLRGFRIELEEIESVLAAHPGVREAAVVLAEPPGGKARLLAWYVPRQGEPPAAAELRRHLRERLPEAMVPAGLAAIAALPVTAHGKLDRAALAALEAPAPRAGAAPRNRRERVLAEVWAAALGLPRVSVHDDFFALGGDSLLAIEVASAATQAGVPLSPRQLFSGHTIAELAAAGGGHEPAAAEQEPVAGELPLTAIQRWFFDYELGDYGHWNTAILLEAPPGLGRRRLGQAVGRLMLHHDVLRNRFRRRGSVWTQLTLPPDGAAPATAIDLTALPEDRRRQALEATAAALQGSLDLARGPLLRIAWFELASGLPGRLLVIVHHLVADAVSLRVLLEDLEQLCARPAGPEEVASLPAKTTSYKAWAERLAGHADSPALRREAAWWLGRPWHQAHRTPVDFPLGVNSRASARSVALHLAPQETRALLALGRTEGAELDQLLIAAIAVALAAWTGQRCLLLGLIDHGRRDLFPEVDLTRTVGWFNSIFPVLIELPAGAGLAAAATAVAEQLGQVPNGGIGYGLLRYLTSDPALAGEVRAIPRHEVFFNYLGRSARTSSRDGLFRPATESPGPAQSPRGMRQSLLWISGEMVAYGLAFQWVYSENKHRRSTIEAVTQSFLRVLEGPF
jgi:amino acid adenylation domain-containing protein/non-ribosomal peptide synthase protein (TIGR01720 family)